MASLYTTITLDQWLEIQMISYHRPENILETQYAENI
jgi:hypothetical protein